MLNRSIFIESQILQLQERILRIFFSEKSSPIIFEIGACEGENSIRYSIQYPEGIIYTFEPLPKNFEIIKKNVESYKKTNINPFAVALSNQIGSLTFYVSSGIPNDFIDAGLDWDFGNKSSSILPPQKTLEEFDWLKFNEKISIPSTTISKFCSDQQINHIDFVHLDVQGSELMVLEGAGNRIQNINMVWLEVEAVEMYKGQPLKNDVEKFMVLNGFKCVIDTVDQISGDQFWIRNDFLAASGNKKALNNLTKFLKLYKVEIYFDKKFKYKKRLNKIKRFLGINNN